GAGVLLAVPPGAVPAATASVPTVAAAARHGMPAVRPGAASTSVQRLQKLLGVTPRSGWYGPKTKRAVRAFKRGHGLGHGSVFGVKAWKVLLRETRAKKKQRAKKHTSRVCPAPTGRFGNDYGDPRTGHSHAGIDMLGRRGDPIKAIETGYVVRAGRQSNGAMRIVIQGTKTGAKYYYGHNSRHLVRAGERFKRGEVIARMGDSGSPGINHLHFEWWKSGGESDQVNPYRLLKKIC
ncbi:MAG TPA: peptidoglycan DD-metalloendopeptidase family protein, partial [Candidatus Nanopelagicales bacterium]|nr:peptidoglycan DD-metalloendopeptidase family protein [Candidatus Nanopelagicales bacterium]